MNITLDKVIDALQEKGVLERYSKNLKLSEMEINNLSYDSRDVSNKTLFICKGKLFKSEYLNKSIDNGVIAYISEEYYEDIPDTIAYIIVKDIREAMYIVADTCYGHAWKDIKTVGITGTKGKTTTTHYLNNILERHLGKRCGMISTIETYTGKRLEESHLTTPEAPDLHKFFRETKDSNIPILIMEVASQGYKVKRTNGITFDIGAFLNISEDHISDVEHSDFEDYLNCKLEFMKNVKTAIININTDFYESVVHASSNAKKIITYGYDVAADYYISNIKKEGIFINFTVNSKGYKSNFKTKMQGKFNVENALAAIIIAKELGVSEKNIKEGIASTEIRGRMNIFEKDGITVVVDFAHNRLSFSALYEMIKQDYPNRRVISVGGAPGGKAYARRKDFGEIIGEGSDYIYLTADDPQFEKVRDICLDIATFIDGEDKWEIIEDRKEAIEKALDNAKKGDIIVFLAKGEEVYQKIKGEFIPYESDLILAKEWSNGNKT